MQGQSESETEYLAEASALSWLFFCEKIRMMETSRSVAVDSPDVIAKLDLRINRENRGVEKCAKT